MIFVSKSFFTLADLNIYFLGEEIQVLIFYNSSTIHNFSSLSGINLVYKSLQILYVLTVLCCKYPYKFLVQ